MADTGAPPADRERSRGLALAVLCSATLMIILDGTIVTVALPSVQRDLGFAPASLTWVMNAYLIAFGGLLLLAGRLGDLLGRKRMFLSGLALFTAASLACGLSGDQQMLIAARFVQGAGAAMVSAVSLGMIVGLYSRQQERARAIAAFSFVGAAGASIGLVLGGVLTEAISWHWIFFVNLPIGVLAGVPATALLSDDQGAGLRAGADALGAILVTAGLMTGVYSLVGTARYGWASAHTLGLAAVAVILIGAFLARQATAARPLLALRIFSSRSVSGANLAQGLVIAAAFGFQVLIALYLQRVLGYSPAAAGLGLLPTAVVIGTVSLALLRATDRALRRARRPAGRPGPGRARAGAAHPHPRARQLPRAPAAGPAGVRRRRWPDAARAGHAGHVGRDPRRRRDRLRAVQHHPAGGRRDRRGAAVHAGRGPLWPAAAQRPGGRSGPDQRLPARLRRGRGAGQRRLRRGGHGAAGPAGVSAAAATALPGEPV